MMQALAAVIRFRQAPFRPSGSARRPITKQIRADRESFLGLAVLGQRPIAHRREATRPPQATAALRNS
jgi:hypothetical protein